MWSLLHNEHSFWGATIHFWSFIPVYSLSPSYLPGKTSVHKCCLPCHLFVSLRFSIDLRVYDFLQHITLAGKVNRRLQWREHNCSGMVKAFFSETSVHLQFVIISLSLNWLNVSPSLVKASVKLSVKLCSIIAFLTGEVCRFIQVRAGMW